MLKFVKYMSAVAVAVVTASSVVIGGPIDDRLAAGKPIRIGFSNAPIWAYPDETGKAKGFVNEITLGILNSMGYDNIEATVTDWSGLIPGLHANRYDLITGGLYILNNRCKNIQFSEPIAQAGDAFIVPRGNPKGIQNYQDILSAKALLATITGYNTVESAKKEGLTDDMIMQVPGPTEVLAAVKAGRADVGAMTYFEAAYLAETDTAVDVTDPSALPEWTQNWVGIGFREADADFMAKFNKVIAGYIGSDAMMAAVSSYGYTKGNLPGDKTTKWICANR